VSKSPSELEVDPTLDGAWRRPLLLVVLRLTAAVCTFWLAGIFATTPVLLRSLFGFGDIALLAAIWLATLPPFSDRVRLAVIETALFGAAANAIMVYGTPPGVQALLFLFILLATLYRDWKGGIAAGVAGLLLVAAGEWGWTSGVLPLGPHVPWLDPGHRDVWVREIFSLFLVIGGITGIVAYVLKEMRAVAQRLRLAEEKFSKAFRISPDAMIITELATGRFIEVNGRHEALTGFSREEVIGRTSIDIGTFRDARDREGFAGPMRETGSVRQVERQIFHRSGRAIDVMYSSEAFVLEGVRCAVTIIQDITERKKAEQSLRESEERFRSFIENAGVGIYRSTPDGRILMANPALLVLAGYDSFEEMALRNLETDNYEPSYPRREFRETIEREGRLSGWEVTWTRRDGSRIFVRESAAVIRGADGRALYYDGIVEDISERKKAEQALRESEERFRNLTEAAFEGLVITENGRILDINDQGLRLFGCERSDMIGRNASDFVSPGALEAMREHFRTGRKGAHEHELVRKDGSRFHAEAHSRVTRMGSRTLRMTAIRDVTERRQAEQRQRVLEEQLRQMQRLEALGTLAGGIAHDFNNILTGILGNLQIAEMDLPAGHPAYVALESADRASRRARDLVARILSFSRPEQEHRAAAPLGPIVRETAQLLSVGLPATMAVRTEIDPGCPSVVFDPVQIHQVIMNLGTNGLHAMRGRGGVLLVELRTAAPGAELRERHPQLNDGHTVRLTLQDSGCGMEADVVKRIFEPFYTTKTSGQGTGLGLAMVHSIMMSHQGAIVVESVPGSGTRFDLYFPAAVEPAPDAKPGARAAGRGGFEPFGRGRKVLLVDDDDAILSIGSNLLARLGFSPVVYSRPTDALGAYLGDPSGFSLVISDLTMPGMNGIELTSQILAVRPDIPVILTSGYLNADAQKRARESGVRCLINKPFDVRELVAQVRIVLGERPGPGA
jgi:PAS domain S-box-containing protein